MATRRGTKSKLLKRTPIHASTSASRLSTGLAVPSLLSSASSTNAADTCGAAQFTSPEPISSFYHRDTVIVTYTSNFSDPTLYCFCGDHGRSPAQPRSPIQKFSTDPTPFNGSEPVLLEFTSPDPCWFELRSDSTASCGDNNRSPQFRVLPTLRPRDGTEAIVRSMSSAAIQNPPGTPVATTIIPSNTTTAEAVSPTSTTTGVEGGGGGLSTGAKVGLGVAIAGLGIASIAMFACFYLRRRRRSNDSTSDGRSRRKRREKLSGGRLGRSGDGSRIQPVLDGFPGSTRYDEVPSTESGGYLHSPSWSQSPTLSSSGRFYWSDREELLAARRNTPSLASYSPSPGAASNTMLAESREGSVFAAPSLDARAKPAKGPLIVSYGPNRVTPTPAIGKSSLPPDDNAVLTQVPDLPVLLTTSRPTTPQSTTTEPTAEPTAQPPNPATHTTTPERKFSWDPQSDPATALLPLPPYASVTDFHAMEKGAIRTVAEPEACAELPPTKDGYYHFGDDSVEYELPADGAARTARETQLPYRLYRKRPDGKPGHQLEEQKFLLSDAEISMMRAKKKAAAVSTTTPPHQPPPGDEAYAGESYEMTGGLVR